MLYQNGAGCLSYSWWNFLEFYRKSDYSLHMLSTNYLSQWEFLVFYLFFKRIGRLMENNVTPVREDNMKK